MFKRFLRKLWGGSGDTNNLEDEMVQAIVERNKEFSNNGEEGNYGEHNDLMNGESLMQRIDPCDSAANGWSPSGDLVIVGARTFFFGRNGARTNIGLKEGKGGLEENQSFVAQSINSHDLYMVNGLDEDQPLMAQSAGLEYADAKLVLPSFGFSEVAYGV